MPSDNAGGSVNVGTGGAPPGASGGAGPGGGSGGMTVGSGASSAVGGTSSASGGASSASGGGPSLPGYYVSPTGDDANPGTADAPFLTIDKAREVVRTASASMEEDLHVYLRGGQFRLTEPVRFEAEDSGKNGYRIVYQAYPGEQPIISGSTSVTDWSAHEGGVYKASFTRTKKLRNLYVNDQRAVMTKRTVTSAGGHGTYSVVAGQADWAWSSGSGSDGIRYDLSAVPEIAQNKDDLEIVNGTTWNENIACVRDVISADGYRVLLLQQPYGVIAQTPGWNAGFSVTGTHTIYNALEFLSEPGEFYFDKTDQTLYYYPRAGEDMATALVEVPQLETLIEIVGASKESRARNLTFQGLTFANTDYDLYEVGESHGKASVQAATAFVAFGDGNWHNSKYDIIDTLPAMIEVDHADSVSFIESVMKHSGSEGITLVNDVTNVELIGNVIQDIAGSGITVGHPQHVYLGDGGERARYSPELEGIAANNSIKNNLLWGISSQPGFGGHSGITAFFVEGLDIEHNQIQTTAYNGISLGWGWRNFQDSTTCKDNDISENRFIDTLSRLHDSGAVYTIGQMPGTTINENYVRGIPPATSGPTYGLHNDEGSAYIIENDNVLDISPGVTYTINAEDFGEKHNLTILRTYATVSKMGIDPPESTIDPPVAIADNVWPLAQYETCLASGVEPEFQHIIPDELAAPADRVFPASVFVDQGAPALPIRSSGNPAHEIWFAPSGTTAFSEGATMTRTTGAATSLAVPAEAGVYKLFVRDGASTVLGESAALLRVE